MIGDAYSGQIQYYDSSKTSLVKIDKNLHTDRITCMKYLSNGYVASSSDDHTVNVWEIETWKTIRNYTDHKRTVNSLDQIDSNTIVSGSNDGTIRIWQISTRETLIIINTIADVYSVRVLTNELVACGLRDTTNNLQIFNLKSGAWFKTLNGHNNTVTSIDILNEQFLASGGYDAKVIIWDMKTFTYKYILEGNSYSIFCVKKISDHMIASAGDDIIINIWNWLDGSLIQTLRGHTGQFYSSSLSMFNETILISGSRDKTIRLWNISNGALVQSINANIPIGALEMIKHTSSINETVEIFSF